MQIVMAASAPELRPDGAAVDGMELRPEKAVGAVDGAIVDRAETWSEEAVRAVDDNAVGWAELGPGGAFGVAEVVDDAAVDWGVLRPEEAVEVVEAAILVLFGFSEGAREQEKQNSLRGEVRYILDIEAGNE